MMLGRGKDAILLLWEFFVFRNISKFLGVIIMIT